MAKNPYDGTPYEAFAKMIPGFDFLEGLVKNAGSTLPQIGQWVAPTLDPEELDKRIKELRTVQFWLEQNARMLAATIQALEVQRMTLSTLKTMNVQMTDLRDTLTARPGETGQTVATPPVAPPPAATPPSPPREQPAARKDMAETPSGDTAAVDPMQWWGALTKQFTQLATSAMKDTAADAAKKFADAIPKTTQPPRAKVASVATKTNAAKAPAVKKAAPAKAARKRRPAAGKA